LANPMVRRMPLPFHSPRQHDQPLRASPLHTLGRCEGGGAAPFLSSLSCVSYPSIHPTIPGKEPTFERQGSQSHRRVSTCRVKCSL
jgi:hypothetical protein